MSRTVIVAKERDTKEVTAHQASGTAGYHTLCGLSLDDDMFSEVLEERCSPRRINCAACKMIWSDARELRANDFSC